MSELRKINLAPKSLDPNVYDDTVVEKIKRLRSLRQLLKDFKVIGRDQDHCEDYGNLSARVQGNRFLCTATQTSRLPDLGREHFPVVYDFHDDTIYWKGEEEAQEPSVEASTHDGFYRGNQRILYVAHGHFQDIHDFYSGGLDAIVFPEEFRYGSLEIREKALESGQDERILQHKTPYGNWGLVIPKGHFNAFFFVGESVKAIGLGLLHCIDQSAIALHNKTIHKTIEIEGEQLFEEDFLGTMRPYV